MKPNHRFLLALILLGVLIFSLGLVVKYRSLERHDINAKQLATLQPKLEQDIQSNDFVYAASVGAPAVVHIKSKIPVQRPEVRIPDPFREFFDDEFWDRFFGTPNPSDGQQPFAEASGSGVIIDSNGYIVTNNHVIDQASTVEIILHDQRSYEGTVVGVDPLTDLALLKIDADDLRFLEFGNSDDTQVGEWVLAVGNPFYNLSSTVTAGIISAKARNINILQDQAAIESFLQTDAAVNRGNSGGALINTKGELIGINTAIASPTGVYAGYAFAIPSNIVHKVIKDLKEYGEVSRASLGVYIRDLNNELINQLGISHTEGVYVDSLLADGSAKSSGVKKGDIILKINDIRVNSAAELQARIGTFRPKERISITLLRGKNQLTIPVKLGSMKKSQLRASEEPYVEVLGAQFKDLSAAERKRWQVEYGVQLIRLNDGLLRRETNIKEGFIIEKLNNQPVRSLTDFRDKLQKVQGGVMLEGKYPGAGKRSYYAFGVK